mmetsp:Transcript_6230/g.9843  ORF Transcript_6230/g.9843 Transcript_6230/m.9843 type:complete len:308 (+) Transcript_6230:1666-2589(+)
MELVPTTTNKRLLLFIQTEWIPRLRRRLPDLDSILQHGRNITNTRQYTCRTISKTVNIIHSTSNTTQNQNCINTRLNTRLYISIHTITNNNRTRTTNIQTTQRTLNHQWIRLTNKICIHTRRRLNRLEQRTRTRNQLTTNTISNIYIRTNQTSTTTNELDRQLDMRKRVQTRISTLTNNNKIRRRHLGTHNIHSTNTLTLQLTTKRIRTNNIRTTTTLLTTQKTCRTHCTRVKMLRTRLQTKTTKLFNQLIRTLITRICQKQILFTTLLQTRHKLLGTRQQTITMVNNTITIYHKSFLFIQQTTSEL